MESPNKLHKFVYLAEGVAAAASLGADGYTTERGIGIAGVQEANPLFLGRGGSSFSQYKFWTYKVGLADVPFVITYVLHKKRVDDALTDALSIGTSGIIAAGFTWVAVHNVTIADRIQRENLGAK
ncbi:MAG TPA: hypothetical protein VMU19_13315 [Bryobacteraceae bacterium]|nr:hypothetical protein [Bryobacteraceae bacterium]